MLTAQTTHLVQASGFLALFIAVTLCIALVKVDSMRFTEIDRVPEFAHGLKILLLDHDSNSLVHTASVLGQNSFNVTAIQQASVALSLISNEKNHYELVMVNNNMSDGDTVTFLHALLEKDIPVILMSSELNADLTKKALDKGASFLLEKPIASEDLKNVWQHAYWKDIGKSNPDEWMDWLEEDEDIEANVESRVLIPSFGGTETKEDGASSRPDWKGTGLETDLKGKSVRSKTYLTDENYDTDLHSYSTEEFFPTGREKQKASGIKQPADDIVKQKKRKMSKPNVEQTSDSKRSKPTIEHTTDSTSRNQEGISKKHSIDSNDKTRKKRIVWTSDLHHKFTTALSALGDERARPKAILNLMDVKNVTMRQVASHLQKYKNQVRRINATGIYTGRISLSDVCNGNVPAKQSSLVFQQKQGTSWFGVGRTVGGYPTESTTPNSFTRSSISVASFNNQDYRMQNLNSSYEGLSHYGIHDTNSPYVSLTHGCFPHFNQIPETRSAYRTDMMEILNKKQPIGSEDSMLKVNENLPSMTYMTSEVDSPNMSTNCVQLPNQPSVVHQEQVSTVIAGKTEVLEPQKMNYSAPEEYSPYIWENALQFSNDLSVVTQEQNCTPVASDPINSETWDKFSTQDEKSELHELIPRNLPSLNYKTPEDASVNQAQNHAQADSSSSNAQNGLSAEVAGVNQLLDFLLDSPSTEYITDGDASTLKSEIAVQLPNEPRDQDLEQYHIPGLTGQNNFAVSTTEHEFLRKETPSSGTINLGNLPADFNNGSQKLDTTTGEAPPAVSPNEDRHNTPAFTIPFSSQNHNKVSAITSELEMLSEQLASSNAKNLQTLPVYFSGESQNLGNLIEDAPQAISSDEIQPLSEYADILKMLEADPEFNYFGNAPSNGTIGDQLEWLEKTLLADSTEQQ